MDSYYNQLAGKHDDPGFIDFCRKSNLDLSNMDPFFAPLVKNELKERYQASCRESNIDTKQQHPVDASEQDLLTERAKKTRRLRLQSLAQRAEESEEYREHRRQS